MTAALQSFHSEPRNSLYTRSLMNEFEFGDNRYPSLRPQTGSTQQSLNLSRPGSSNRSWLNQPATMTSSSDGRPTLPDSPQVASPLQLATEDHLLGTPTSRHDQRSLNNQTATYDQMQENNRNALSSSSLPPGAARRTVDRYNWDDNAQPTPEPTQTFVENKSVQETVTGRSRPRTPISARVNSVTPQGRASPNPSLSRRSTLQNSRTTPPPLPDGVQIPPIIPLSASPTYSPPVAPNHRAYAQQPTYVTQQNASNPIQPVYTPIVPQQEEVCVECAMRDQDMADVDVTSPGVWDRASDVAFEELKKKEIEEAAAGIVSSDPKRPRIKGGRLTDQNLKIWLSINPREPASRQQTLNTYIKAQRALLEAEALAHSRALQEAKQLDNRMRDAYSQLRRSAYDIGNATSPIDDLGGVRIKPPLSPISPASHNRPRSHSREVTLLENGMIVEHVDVRKEEKEAKGKRKKEEKRARKSSRSSVLEVGSIISQSSGQLVDAGLRPSSRFSHAYSVRPASVFSPSDRPDIPRAYSQISFSDAQSLGSASPRRTRFFGMKNLNAGWRSQDSLAPSGMSGSMVDMHLALQRDGYRGNALPSHTIDLNASSRGQIWPPVDLPDSNISQVHIQDEKAKKKVGGLAKIWRKVTGKSEGEKAVSPTLGPHDDYPLAPPPPLSYLVDRKSQNDFNSNGAARHGSTNSLPSSVASPKFLQGQLTPGMSPPTAPSSILPSPASLRHSGDIEIADGRQTIYENPLQDDSSRQEETLSKFQGINWQSMQPIASEMDLRQNENYGVLPAALIVNGDTGNNNSTLKAISLSREKSLPPIPVGECPAQLLPSDRPKTLYGLDSTPKQGSRDLAPPEVPFVDTRPRSFGGTSSRPNLALQTMPVTKPVDFDSKRSFGPRYDEFAMSLGRLDHIQENPWPLSPHPNNTTTTTRRKSKFVLSSLLGKKDKREPEFDGYPSLPYSPYDNNNNQDDMTTAGYATSNSRHSAPSTGTPNMRMSVYGRKPLEALVQQDPDFIAYRYPSGDQPLDLLR